MRSEKINPEIQEAIDKALESPESNILTIEEGRPWPKPWKNPAHGRNFILFDIAPGRGSLKQVWSLHPSPIANNFKLEEIPNSPLCSPLPMSMYAKENINKHYLFEGTDGSLEGILKVGTFGWYLSAPNEHGLLEGARYNGETKRPYAEKGEWKWHEETKVAHLYKGEHVSGTRGHCEGEFMLVYGPPWSKQVRLSHAISLSNVHLHVFFVAQKLLKGTKRKKDGSIWTGTWPLGVIGGHIGCWFTKGKIESGKYSGLIREGDFMMIKTTSRNTFRCLLKSGKMTLQNGDIWEGEFRDYQFYETGSSQNESEMRFLGSVHVTPSNGEKKKGIWKCIDTGEEYKIEKYVRDVEDCCMQILKEFS